MHHRYPCIAVCVQVEDTCNGRYGYVVCVQQITSVSKVRLKYGRAS